MDVKCFLYFKNICKIYFDVKFYFITNTKVLNLFVLPCSANHPRPTWGNMGPAPLSLTMSVKNAAGNYTLWCSVQCSVAWLNIYCAFSYSIQLLVCVVFEMRL